MSHETYLSLAGKAGEKVAQASHTVSHTVSHRMSHDFYLSLAGLAWEKNFKVTS